MIAENGVARGVFEKLDDVCGEGAEDSGEARSVNEAEDSRSVIAETGPVVLFEDSICEDVYIFCTAKGNS